MREISLDNNSPENKERESLIQRLVSNPRFSHGVFGKFGDAGHSVQVADGSSSLPRELFKNEALSEKAFSRDTGSLEFKARVITGVTEKGEKFFVLTFNDRQGDSRPGSHTDYALVFPPDEPIGTYDEIKQDPRLLIEVFRRKYHHYDRSKGMLNYDDDFKILEI